MRPSLCVSLPLPTRVFSFIPTSVALHILSYFTFNLLVGPKKGKWEEGIYVKAGSTETSWKISAQ